MSFILQHEIKLFSNPNPGSARKDSDSPVLSYNGLKYLQLLKFIKVCSSKPQIVEWGDLVAEHHHFPKIQSYCDQNICEAKLAGEYERGKTYIFTKYKLRVINPTIKLTRLSLHCSKIFN